jgi:hypothetical protein
MSNVVYVAWRSPAAPEHKWGPVGRLDTELGHFRFVYTEGARLLEGFEPFPGMPGLSEVYESDELLPVFKNRMLSKSRPEYKEFLKWSGFDPAIPPEPLALLGVTEGKRETDFIEIFPCPCKAYGNRLDLKFFLHGIRHMPSDAQREAGKLTSGERLGLMLDISNPHDKNAVAIRTCPATELNRRRYLIGYLPRYLARDVHGLAKTINSDDLNLTVEQVNEGAPFQQMLLCRLDSIWPEEFCPCDGEEYSPIPAMSS